MSPSSFVLGGVFSDTADLGTPPAGATPPTGTVTFDVYADATCQAAPVLTSTKSVASSTVTSADFKPTTTGDYRVIATYSGDSNYKGKTSACADAAEVASVTKATLTMSTAVSDDSISVGDSFTDTATLSSIPDDVAKPTGTVTFDLYATSGCTGMPLASRTANVTADGTTGTSDAFVATDSGTYHVIATYSGDANYAGAQGACNDTGENVTVGAADLSFGTQVSDGDITLGDSFHDVATLGASSGSTPTGSVDFKVYGPADDTCSDTPVFSDSAPLSGGTTATSADWTPADSGTYRVVAQYSGDVNYNGKTSDCADAKETVSVGKAGPTLTTTVSPSAITLGDKFHDVATVGAPAGVTQPTGTVRFDVYGPADPTCAGTPVASSTNDLAATATSDDFRPTAAGDYHVVAHYGGDSNYAAADTACGDANETVSTAKAALGLTTRVAPVDISLGESFTDTATLGAPPAGAAKPTGSVEFDVYGPGDTSCTGAVAFKSTNAVSGTAVQSDSFTPTAAGRYRVIARYSGDSNYKAAASDCADATETVGVKAVLTLTDTPSADVTVGGALTDTAHLAGGANPTGTITFTLYGPDDTSCSGTPVATSKTTVGSGDGAYVSDAVTPTTAGTYRWIASYSGDDDNRAATTTCGHPVTVNAKPPDVQTPGGQAEQPPALSVRLSHLNVRLSGGKARILLRCSGAKGQTCAGALGLRATHLKSRLDAAATAKNSSFKIAAGSDKTLKVTLPKATVAQLKKSRKAVAYAVVSMRDARGRTKSTRIAITVIR